MNSSWGSADDHRSVGKRRDPSSTALPLWTNLDSGAGGAIGPRRRCRVEANRSNPHADERERCFRERAALSERPLTPMGAGGGAGCASGELRDRRHQRSRDVCVRVGACTRSQRGRRDSVCPGSRSVTDAGKSLALVPFGPALMVASSCRAAARRCGRPLPRVADLADPTRCHTIERQVKLVTVACASNLRLAAVDSGVSVENAKSVSPVTQAARGAAGRFGGRSRAERSRSLTP